MAATPNWPPLPEVAAGDQQADSKKILYQAQVQFALARQQAADEAEKAQLANDADMEKAAWAAEYTARQAVMGAYLDVAKASIDRAQARAIFIQTAAAAVSTAYAGLLALSYKPDGTARPLPVQAVVPTVFFGLAIVLVSVYLGYIRRQGNVAGPEPAASLEQNQGRRVDAFIQWASALITPRLYFLHSAVVSLAVGVSLLPMAYLDVPVATAAIVAGFCVLIVFVLPLLFSRDSAEGS